MSFNFAFTNQAAGRLKRLRKKKRDFLIHLCKKAKSFYDIRILWVRGHSKDWGNQLADKYAGEGAEALDELHIGTARPSDWGFSEFRRDCPQHFAGSQGMAHLLLEGGLTDR